MTQSRIFTDHSATINVKQNETKQLVLLLDSVIDLTDSNVYVEGRLKVWKPDGTILISQPVIILRNTNSVQVNVTAEDNSIPGNWAGEIEFTNGTIITDHSFTFNYNILESF